MPAYEQTTSNIVLVCDDDPTHLLLMRETLEVEGFIVIEACNGELALKQYREHNPQIVLLDVKMPLKDGFEVCREIRLSPQGKDIPILMVTSFDDFTSVKEAYSAGATDFLPKPIKWPMISHRIKYILRNSEALNSLKKSQKRLRHLAYHDSLTGLHNRQYFTEQFEKFIQLAKQNDVHTALLLIDLDRFKRINDTLGYAYGDKILKEVAKRLSDSIKSSDLEAYETKNHISPVLARLEGDEFTITLSQIDISNNIVAIAGRILESLSHPFKIDDFEVVITPSIGISVYPNDGDNVELLLKNADAAMQYAKKNGRNCFKFYLDSMNVTAMERLKLEGALRDAVKNDEFELHYQPQINLVSNSINSVEAVLRWNHPTLGMVSPLEFIPLAEESGLIIEIGKWVLETACKQGKAWLDSGINPIRVAVNISGLQFKRPNFIEIVNQTLKEYNLPAQMLELELTETILMSDVEENVVRLFALKKLGVSIAIDDFGTGYSSLSYLKRFPLDILKIDQSFIIDIANNENDAAIVAAIMVLATTMNIDVVAEGVETEQQVLLLQKNACTMAQGYYFSRPLNEVECTKLLRRDFIGNRN